MNREAAHWPLAGAIQDLTLQRYYFVGEKSTVMKIKKKLLLAGILSFNSIQVLASSATGVVSVYHLNSKVANRVSCIQMNPALSTVWACIHNDNSLYKEINALLLSGYAAGKTCEVFWDVLDENGYAKIWGATCK